MDRPTADRSTPPAPAPPRRGLPADQQLGRFSPLTAPERDVVDQFCADTRPWALRQAKRSYRHLPQHLREQAVDRAMQELRTSAGGQGSVHDRRTLMSQFADLLTESLRHLHVGWCLNESTARLRREGLETREGYGVARDGLAEFVEHGLGGLERAVLQLEIGAGRDSRTTRAALRLGPREYSRHREAGLSKLRDAIGARVAGRVCDQHLSSVVLAATGDRRAQTVLQGGASRCRACAREAQGLRSVLNERLAVAPWPLIIKPAGLVAAKVGGLTAIFGGKAAGGAAGGAALTSGGAGAGAAATVVAIAAIATGTTAMVDGSEKQIQRLPGATSAAAKTANAAPARAGRKVRVVRAATKPRAGRRTVEAKARPTAELRVQPSAKRQRVRRQAPAAPTTAAAVVPAPQAVAPAPAAPPTLGTAVDRTVAGVNQTAKGVTKALPPALRQPLDQTLDNVGKTVNGLTGTVDALLQPKP